MIRFYVLIFVIVVIHKAAKVQRGYGPLIQKLIRCDLGLMERTTQNSRVNRKKILITMSILKYFAEEVKYKDERVPKSVKKEMQIEFELKCSNVSA